MWWLGRMRRLEIKQIPGLAFIGVTESKFVEKLALFLEKVSEKRKKEMSEVRNALFLGKGVWIGCKNGLLPLQSVASRCVVHPAVLYDSRFELCCGFGLSG